MFLRQTTAIAALSLIALSFGSETNSGTPLFSSAPDTGFESIAAYSTGITGNAGNGSGALYFAQQSVFNGQNTMFLNVATAAHVVDGNAGFAMRLHMANTIVNLNAGNSAFFVQDRGAGAYLLPEDMAWMGVRVQQNQVDNITWNFLTGLDAVNGVLASAFPAVNSVLTNFGFGRSGRYYFDDFDPVANTHTGTYAFTYTPGLQGNGHTRTPLGFNWQDNIGANDQYGIDRLTHTIANGVFVYTDGTFKYDSVQWDFRPDANTGQINSGDSGGAILNAGSLIGLNTYAYGNAYTFNAGANRGEDFLYGSLGGGIAFTPQDVTFLNDRARTFVPEPASCTVLGVLGRAATLRRRRKS